ncbi:MAG: FtsX-like permease family protein [Gammaproteobacteria bacterium]|nr:FtsX-like permease family protein [Gammaproteobacteria bacterium]
MLVKSIISQITYNSLRTLFTCCAVASALALILLLEGFQSGLLMQLKNVALNRGADLIVAQSGVSNFVASRSLLPQLSRERIEAVDGVVEAHPITMVPVIYNKPGYRKSPIFFVVYDTLGGPLKLREGKAPAIAREIVIDESFVVADFEFRVSGIATRASALFTAFSFITYDDMIDFFFDSDLVGDISNLPLLSYLLVELNPGADRSAVRVAIESVEPEADVFEPGELALNDEALGRTLFGPVIGVLISAGYIIALLVVGMIAFASVHARLRNFGLKKALGFTNRALAIEMVLEALVIVFLSFPLALLLAILASSIIESLVPLYQVPVLEPVPLARTIIAALVLAAIGAYLPYRLIARLDPAQVFRN